MTGPSCTPLTHFPHSINSQKKRPEPERKQENREIPPILLQLPPSKFLLHHIKGLINLISLNYKPGSNCVRPLAIPVHSPRAIGIGIELERIGPGRFGEVSGGDGRAHVKLEFLAIFVESAVHGRCTAVRQCQDKVPGGGSGAEGSEEEEGC